MTPSVKTGALAAGLALTSLALVAGGPQTPLLGHRSTVGVGWLAGGLAVLFFLADLCLLHIEVRREAMSVTLAGIPVALGILLCGPRELVVARVLGSALAFAVQRASPGKAAYNLAAYAFETALDLTLVHLFLHRPGALTASVAAACWVVLLAVDQLMGLLVVRVISWHQGRPDVREILGLQLSGLLTSALATAAAYGLLLLLDEGPVGFVVLSMFLAAAAVAYRSFQVLHRRHQSLAHVHEFVALNDEDGTVSHLAGVMLEQVRELMRSETAELLLTGSGTVLHLRVREGQPPQHQPHGQSPDLDLQAVAPGDQPVLLPRRTRDRRHRAWLRARGAQDAVVVPLGGPTGDSVGALVVLDRLGGTGSFNRDDQTLLQTLGGHLAVAVNSGWRRERLRHEATHDHLTRLGNRALLNEAIDHELARDAGGGAVLLLLDLDRFKEVNDTLGHHVGDALLSVIAGRLHAALPADATIARLGGDEFSALIPPPGRPGRPEPVAAWAERVARELAGALAVPVELPEAILTTRASIGVALLSPQSTGSQLLRQADTAMYVAKAAQSGVVVYSPELDRGRTERLALLADLHLALDRGELTVVYQPKLDLLDDRLTCVEALVRWQHPRLGLLSPDVFIPLAEANGLIAPLTREVLGQALRQCASWHADGLEIAVAVNISARTVNDPALPEQVSDALLRAGVPASQLVLEITESAVMDDPDHAEAILRRIAAIGVSLSLDDFGTGYSSLAYLQRLPVGEVKIDRSFVSGLTDRDSNSEVLVRSIINLGVSLGLRVVAEGVEDSATLDLLRDLGCHLAQGYHIGRPQAPERIAEQVRRHQPSRPALRAVAAPAGPAPARLLGAR